MPWRNGESTTPHKGEEPTILLLLYRGDGHCSSVAFESGKSCMLFNLLFFLNPPPHAMWNKRISGFAQTRSLSM